jgi:hypothetical protein
MKLSQICALFSLLIVGSTLALADGINDPKIIVHGVNGGNSLCGPHNCQGVGTNFSFDIPKSGSGFLYFTNISGKNWTSLTLIVEATGIAPSSVSCAETFFLSCRAKTLKDGDLEIIMSGVRGALNPEKGLPNGQNFTIGFACNPSCWPKGGIPVIAHAGAVPEPGTAALVVTGLGAIFSRRKMRKNRFSS